CGPASGLASMGRAESCSIGVGMVIAALLRREGRRQIVPLLAGFGGVLLLYVLVLQNKTGNAIYPLYWNFLANVTGLWGSVATSDQAAIRPVLGAALLAGTAGLAWTLWKRPPSYMLLTFGFGYWIFTAGMFGFTSFLYSWFWWTLISR